MGKTKLGIHDYLKKQGYQINFLLSGLHESFVNLKQHYGENIDTYIESKYYPQFNVNNDEFLFAALNDVQNFSGTPNFFFVHLMSPHIAGVKQKRFDVFQPSFDYASLVRRQKREITINKDAIALFTNSYDNSIMQADDIIRRFLNKLEIKGFMENALVVILGDHGESLGEHNPKFGHKHGLWQEYIGVPIIFMDDDTTFYKERSYASQIDVAPTIADRLDLPIPNIWEGTSLKNDNKSKTSFHETQNADGNVVLASVNKRGKRLNKFIYVPATDERYFYNLIKDPKEKKNIIASCKNPQKFINALLKNQSKKSKKYVSKVQTPKETEPAFSSFLSKQFVAKQLGIEVDIFKNADQKSNAESNTSFFTWSENNVSNTMIVEIVAADKESYNEEVLLNQGLLTTHRERKRFIPSKVGGQDYYFSNDNEDIVKFHKDKLIRVSSINKSKYVNRASLIKLVSAIQREL